MSNIKWHKSNDDWFEISRSFQLAFSFTDEISTREVEKSKGKMQQKIKQQIALFCFQVGDKGKTDQIRLFYNWPPPKLGVFRRH